MFKTLALSGAALLAAAPALAQVAASAATDLNLRAGPGSAYEIVGVIPSGGAVDLQGCLEEANWCAVTFEGTEGWAYGDYLSATLNDAPVVVYEARADLAVPAITYEAPEAATETDEAAGAAVGATIAATLVGGPAAIAAGAALGALAEDADDEVVTFVRDNPVDPLVVEGEVIVGAGIPAEVTLAPVPETAFSYAYLNGVPVIVDNESRQIVRIVR